LSALSSVKKKGGRLKEGRKKEGGYKKYREWRAENRGKKKESPTVVWKDKNQANRKSRVNVTIN